MGSVVLYDDLTSTGIVHSFISSPKLAQTHPSTLKFNINSIRFLCIYLFIYSEDFQFSLTCISIYIYIYNP